LRIALADHLRERSHLLMGSAGQRQSAASILLPGVAILRALLFGRWSLSIFCWTSNLLYMALGLPHQQ
jgi:hypothetical protein